MGLDEYLWRNKISRTDFALLIGISRSYLQQILSRKRNPSVKLAKKIEEVTEGKVSKEEMLFPEEFHSKEDL